MLYYAKEMLGGAGRTDSWTLTSGLSGSAPNRFSGYRTAAPIIGSLSPLVSAVYGGATVNAIYWNENGGAGGPYFIELAINANVANSGWTTLTIGATTFLRSAGSYTAGAITAWDWTYPSNIFGIAGTVTTVTLT